MALWQLPGWNQSVEYSWPMDQKLIFRINDTGLGPELLEQVFLERGWTEYDQEVHGLDGWNIWWRTTKFRTGEYASLLPWQWINHFPNCALLTKKDGLCRNIRKMRVAHGFHVYNFCPPAFNLPNDYTKFVSEYAHVKQQQQQQGQKENPPPRPTWICKPAESSRGRGIFVFSELADLQYDCNAVVQEYIADPLLIGGYKFDIRVYVAVRSFHPLQIYVHEEGLVRFSTEKYDLARLDNVFSHLTNTSINKHSPGYMADKEEVGHGCKWTISQLRRYFLQNNISDAHIWQQITNIIVLTVLIQAPSAPKITNCFELYGFDILIDQALKAWLLEVNFSPSLGFDCQVDVIAKKAMLHDLMTLLDFSDAGLDLMPDSQQQQPEHQQQHQHQSPRGHYYNNFTATSFREGGHTARTTASTTSHSSSSHHTAASSSSRSSHPGGSNSRYARSHRGDGLSGRRGGRGARQQQQQQQQQQQNGYSSTNPNHSSSSRINDSHSSSCESVNNNSSLQTDRTEDDNDNNAAASAKPRKTSVSQTPHISSSSLSSMTLQNASKKGDLDSKGNNSRLAESATAENVAQNCVIFRHDSADATRGRQKPLAPKALSTPEEKTAMRTAGETASSGSTNGTTNGTKSGGEFHISSNSDSGLSSLSSNCDIRGSNDNSNGSTRLSTGVQNGGEDDDDDDSGGRSALTLTTTARRESSSSCIGAEIVSKLQDTQQMQRLGTTTRGRDEEEAGVLAGREGGGGRGGRGGGGGGGRGGGGGGRGRGVGRAGVETLELDSLSEEGQHREDRLADGINYEVKLVKGNMKGQGVKQIISPIPPINLKKESKTPNNSNKLATEAGAGVGAGAGAGAGTSRGKVRAGRGTAGDKVKISPKDHHHHHYRSQNPKSHNSSPLFNGAPNNSLHHFRDRHLAAVPRNLSVLEATRFQHHFYHNHYHQAGFPAINHGNPGKNGRAPLTKIPKKRVGRFFLVFPFNEATQKHSASGKLDAKFVIREIMKRAAMRKKRAAGNSSPTNAAAEESGGDNGNSIWVPIKCAD